MARLQKLLKKAKQGPNNLNYDDLRALVLALGFTHRSTKGSHDVFTQEAPYGLLTLQRGKDGKAKPYQVKQVLAWVDEHLDDDDITNEDPPEDPDV